MRFLGTAALLLALAALTGCGAGDGDPDDVPTITTRPSASRSAKPMETATQLPSAASTPPVTTVSPTAPPATGTTESGPSPEPPTDDPGGPTSYDDAQTRIAEVGAASTQEVVAAERFSTTKDVVYCLLDDPVIGPSCELRTGFVKDDAVCGSDIADGVGRIETYKGRARPVCNSDTIREPGAPVVAAPAVVASGPITCAVESVGVTCTDAGSHTGFFIGPREYHVF